MQVFTSLTAARDLLLANGARPHLLLHPDALPEFAGMDTSKCVYRERDSVFAGLGEHA